MVKIKDDQIYGNAIFEQMAGFLQETNNNGNNLLTAQIKEYKLYLKDKEKQDAEFEFNVISNIYKTSTSAIKGIWNKISKIIIF